MKKILILLFTIYCFSVSAAEKKTNFSMDEIVNLLLKYPELVKINSGIMRNEGHKKLYDNDKLMK